MQFNVFLNGTNEYFGSVEAADFGEALELAAETLRTLGFDQVSVEHSMDAVYFWGWDGLNGLVYATKPDFEVRGYCAHYISIAKPFTFTL